MEDKIELVEFNKDNVEHIKYFKKLRDDKSISIRFQGLFPYLLRKGDTIFNRGFFLSYQNELVGYIDIGEFHEEEEAVYFRGAIDNEHRGKSLGKKMLKDVTEYVCNNYSYVKYIKLKIHKDNKPSINVALSNGYKQVSDELYILENPNYIKALTK